MRAIEKFLKVYFQFCRRVPSRWLSAVRDAALRDGRTRPCGGRMQPEADLMSPVLQNVHALEPLRVTQKVPPKAETATVSMPVLWKGNSENSESLKKGIKSVSWEYS